MEAQNIIIKPILSEKSFAGIQNKVYTFLVNKNAGKIEIKKAVEELFGVKAGVWEIVSVAAGAGVTVGTTLVDWILVS